VNPKAAGRLRKSAMAEERRKVDFSIPEIVPGIGNEGRGAYVVASMEKDYTQRIKFSDN
jgi:hypothetical protein